MMRRSTRFGGGADRSVGGGADRSVGGLVLVTLIVVLLTSCVGTISRTEFRGKSRREVVA